MPRRTVPPARARIPVLVAAAGLLLAILPACTAGDDTEGAERLTDDLATALTTRDLGNLQIDGGGQKELDAVLGSTTDLTAKVSPGDVAVDGDTATAALTWTWETPGERVDLRDRGRPLPATGDAWQVTWSPALVEPSLEEGESLDATTLQPRRGDILGAGGAPLVTMRPVVRFGIDKTKVTGARAVASARALAGLLDIAPAPYAKLVRNAGEKAFVEALVLRESDAGQVDRGALGSIQGAVALGGEMPLAPTREFAAPDPRPGRRRPPPRS